MNAVRHLSWLVMFASIAAPCLEAGCANDPAVPSALATQTTQSTGSATAVRGVGDLTFSNCGSQGCEFEGEVLNDGPDCVSNVRGVTHLFDQAGKELGSQAWTINGRVRPGQRVSFKGCCFSSAAVGAHASQRTDVTFNTIQCI